ncbi:MAG: metallophosphoesterase family protein [Lamprobacter sp.]|uniref:metallophosphoesterase family protein n=1 Tax=Lamprobacter sp. TaxID=3100796 RepID=UPI002B25EA58|nr:metallophosphoesterase family protein [Lamprobacter sp.]MEA3641105.1 metallophosphoesterase family protein [Lamprobacter sp.]
MRIYAVGDIHGRADLVEQLQHQIGQDAAEHAGKELHLIYLGDYVDRGPNSREVLELLSAKPPVGLVSHCLMGNHEQAMLNFLDDPVGAAQWLKYGGLETIESYTSDGWEIDPDDVTGMAMALRDALPEHQLAFLKGLELYQCFGHYLFVHAGIRPGVPLKAQRADDLLWIRGEFLNSAKVHPFVVVHGHHVGDAVEVHSNRICVDTGAYATGSLSCLILDGADRLRMDTREGGPFPLEGEAYAHG